MVCLEDVPVWWLHQRAGVCVSWHGQFLCTLLLQELLISQHTLTLMPFPSNTSSALLGLATPLCSAQLCPCCSTLPLQYTNLPHHSAVWSLWSRHRIWKFPDVFWVTVVHITLNMNWHLAVNIQTKCKQHMQHASQHGTKESCTGKQVWAPCQPSTRRCHPFPAVAQFYWADWSDLQDIFRVSRPF